MKKKFKEFKRALNEELAKIDESSALHIGRVLGVDFNEIPLEEFVKGCAVEFEEHPDVHKGNAIVAAQIALAHLREGKNYYQLLEEMEKKLK